MISKGQVYCAGAIIGIALLAGASLGQCELDPFQKLLPHDGLPEDLFSTGVAVEGSTAFVGAIADDEMGIQAGSAYVYEFTGTEWIERAEIFASDGDERDSFGWEIDMSGDLAVIGARNDDTWWGGFSAPGSAYVFRYDGQDWLEEAKLTAPDAGEYDHFGEKVAVGGNVVAVAAPDHATVGAFYIFRYDGTNWVQEQKIFATARCGQSMAMEDDLLVIGDPCSGSESALIYRFDGSQWFLDQQIHDRGLGVAVAISGDVLVIGSHAGPGAVVVARFDGSEYQVEQTILPVDGDSFGSRMALENDLLLVGGRTDHGFKAAVFVFRNHEGNWLQERTLVSPNAHSDVFASKIGIGESVAVVSAEQDAELGFQAGAAFSFDLREDPCLDLNVQNLVAGQNATFTIKGGTAGARVVTVFGLQRGTTLVNDHSGYCATFCIDGVKPSRVIGGTNVTFDGNGEASFAWFIPPKAADLSLFFQSAERGTCPDECVSNRVGLLAK